MPAVHYRSCPLCEATCGVAIEIEHGWGHGRAGVRLSVASRVPGASINDVIDPARVDSLSGTSALSGQPVEVTPV